jgi:hypothetical protein
MPSSETFFLSDPEHEDEAMATGLKFEIFADGRAIVSATFADPDYEEAWGNPTEMTVADARKAWADALRRGFVRIERNK